VRIPLPDLLRKHREAQVDRGIRPWYERLALRGWSWLAAHPRLYGLSLGLGIRVLKLMGDERGLIHKLPFVDGWTAARDLPAPAGRTFRELYAQKRRGR
jgi:L-lactate utilization protein LutB